MPRDKVNVAKQAVDAYNRRDIDGFFAELATRDFEFHAGIGRALGGDVYRGREGAERFDRDRGESWEEVRSIAEEFRDLGDSVLVLGTVRGRGRDSGAPVEAAYVNILDFRGDRIWRMRAYFDRADGLRAAGLSE